jgi:hypothetical protein
MDALFNLYDSLNTLENEISLSLISGVSNTEDISTDMKYINDVYNVLGRVKTDEDVIQEESPSSARSTNSTSQFSLRYKRKEDKPSSSNSPKIKKTPIPYSDIRHLNSHKNRLDGYNYSTIDWYLNLCSQKYERTPSPHKREEVKVKWVGQRKTYRSTI